MFSPQVLDHFEHPRNAGEVENPDIAVQLENPACGDVLRLTLRMLAGRIVDVRFRAKGCVASMACASQLTELMKGKSPEELRKIVREHLVTAIGGLPPESTHASHLAMDTLAAVLKYLAKAHGPV
jgi:nitrogen fixation protein NifU and related proteins